MDYDSWLELLTGAWTTVWICAISITLGTFLGLVIAIIRHAKVPFITQFLTLYISLVRATPLITLLLFIFLSLPAVGIELDMYTSAILSLVFNCAAFNAEIWRSALDNFSKDQYEAAQAIGMTRNTYFFRIMLPQLITTSLPALVNDMSVVIKGSPAIAVIGLVDLTRATNRISAITYEPLPPILGAALIYILIISVLLKVQKMAEKKAHRLAI